MSNGINIYFDEEKQVWDIKPEPFAVIEVMTEEDFNFVKEATEHHKKRGDWVLEREPDGNPFCYHCSNCDWDFSYIGIKTAYDFCPRCGVKMNTDKILEISDLTSK